ncbi:hypothetical protein D3C78_1085260 [compost metagenome]
MQFVEFGVVTGLQHAAVADDGGRVVDDGFFQQGGQLGIGAGGDGQLVQVRCFQLAHRHLQFRQGTQRIAQARQVTRACIAQADPRKNPLDVADFFQLRLQSFEAIAVEQARDRALARLQHLQVAQRAVQPAGQQTAAHGGLATVDHRLQGVVAAPGQVGVQLQVTAAGTVQYHGIVQAFVTQAAQMGQGGALGFLGVAQ